MKAEFNKNWNRSTQPRKQVKFRAKAPLHIKRKFLGSHVKKTLREKYGRTLVVRKGDEVKVMKGKFKGKLGKVEKVDVKNTRLQIAGLQRSKRGGEKLETWFNPSNVMIVVVDTNDSRRFKKKVAAKTEEKKTETKMENKENAPKKK